MLDFRFLEEKQVFGRDKLSIFIKNHQKIIKNSPNIYIFHKNLNDKFLQIIYN
jgi:hypothetical protein